MWQLDWGQNMHYNKPLPTAPHAHFVLPFCNSPWPSLKKRGRRVAGKKTYLLSKWLLPNHMHRLFFLLQFVGLVCEGKYGKVHTICQGVAVGRIARPVV